MNSRMIASDDPEVDVMYHQIGEALRLCTDTMEARGISGSESRVKCLTALGKLIGDCGSSVYHGYHENCDREEIACELADKVSATINQILKRAYQHHDRQRRKKR